MGGNGIGFKGGGESVIEEGSPARVRVRWKALHISDL